MNFGGTIRLNKLGVCIVAGVFFVFVLYISSTRYHDGDKSNVVNLKKLLIGCIETAVKGGKEVVEVNKEPDIHERSKGKTKQGANDPVTNADERSHCAMYFSLMHTFTKIKVVSEEMSSESACRTLQNLDLDPIVLQTDVEFEEEEVNAEDVTVWIDPLDATQEFTEKLFQYVTTMVCVAVKGVPVIGVVHKPFGEEPKTSWAWVGKGYSKNLNKKQNGVESNISIIVSRSHAGNVETTAKKAFGDKVSVIPAGGSGYKSLEVAVSNVTLYVHTTEIKKWDICAGNAILNALGGKMTDLNNNVIDYSSSGDHVNKNGLLATLQNHEEYIEKLKSINE